MTSLPSLGWGFLIAVLISATSAGLSLIRTDPEDRKGAFLADFFISLVVLTIVNFIAFLYIRPMLTFPVGMMPLIFVDFLVATIICVIIDFATGGFDTAVVFTAIITVVAGLWWFGGVQFSGHSAHGASHIVPVQEATTDAFPPSTLDNLAVVTPGMAQAKATAAMSFGKGGQDNYNSLLDPGPGTMQLSQGKLVYAYPLMFQGAINKGDLHARVPGYITMSATNPQANGVPHYLKQDSMIVSLNGGGGSEPDRWVRDHGFADYLTGQPVFQLNPQGDPYFVVPLLRPHLAWSFYAPSAIALVNAHTGLITKYDIGHIPWWISEVYSATMAKQIVNWYGFYRHASFGGQGNGDRYKVSGPLLKVYTGGRYPVWRMFLTSFGNENSAYKIVEMDPVKGTLHVYTPKEPMTTEGSVLDHFSSASGAGGGQVRSNQYQPEGLQLIDLDGHPTYMVTFVTKGNSYVGTGFLDAYHATASNAVFGSSLSAALQNYEVQLVAELSNNSTSGASQGGQFQTVTGTVDFTNWDMSGGDKQWYFFLKGDPHAYFGTSAQLGPVVLSIKDGNKVVMRVLRISLKNSSVVMQNMTNLSNTSLKPTGS